MFFKGVRRATEACFSGSQRAESALTSCPHQKGTVWQYPAREWSRSLRHTFFATLCGSDAGTLPEIQKKIIRVDRLRPLTCRVTSPPRSLSVASPKNPQDNTHTDINKTALLAMPCGFFTPLQFRLCLRIYGNYKPCSW